MLLGAKSIYVICQRAKGAIEAPSSCCRLHIEILMVYRAVDKNNLVHIDEPRHRHKFVFTYNFSACMRKCVFV